MKYCKRIFYLFYDFCKTCRSNKFHEELWEELGPI